MFAFVLKNSPHMQIDVTPMCMWVNPVDAVSHDWIQEICAWAVGPDPKRRGRGDFNFEIPCQLMYKTHLSTTRI